MIEENTKKVIADRAMQRQLAELDHRGYVCDILELAQAYKAREITYEVLKVQISNTVDEIKSTFLKENHNNE